MDDSTVLTVQGLRKRYGDTVAVDGVDITLRRGEILGLLGPNGAGKTTTLECLEGLRRPDQGTVDVMGMSPRRGSRAFSSAIGVQLQSGGLPPSMRVGEAMRFFCAYHRVTPRRDLLVRLGLEGKLGAQYRELSVGQQRRLALALAIAHRPALLFLDEPTAGLDVQSRNELHALLAELKAENTAILLATHDMAETEKLADRVAILLGGRVVAQGTPLELTAAGGGLTKVSVRSERSVFASNGHSLPGVVRSAASDEYAIFFTADTGATVAGILSFLDSQQDRLVDLRVERPSLEERFLEITAHGGSR